MDQKLKFEDVKSCKTIEELNDFIRKYLEERQLKGEERRKTYWHCSMPGKKPAA